MPQSIGRFSSLSSKIGTPRNHTCASSAPDPRVADAESSERFWWPIFHRHCNPDRASTSGRRPSLSFQQQRRCQRAFQRNRSRGSHERNLHSQHVLCSHLNFHHNLSFVQRHDPVGDSWECFCSVLSARSQQARFESLLQSWRADWGPTRDA